MPDYSSVLTDLYAKRAKIDSAIQAIEELAVDSVNSSTMKGLRSSGHQNRGSSSTSEFKGMTIAAATIKHLQRVGEPQLTADIAEALKAGGLGSNSKSLYRTVYNTLVARMKQNKDITKVGSKWSLPS